MRRITTPLLLALSLLTTLPVGHRLPVRIRAVDQGRSVICYPLVGLIIGVVLVVAEALFRGATPLLAAALLLTVWVAVTGALHLDGLADCVDAGFVGHRDATRILTVMKDPAAGPVAVVAIAIVLLLKFTALATLLAHGGALVGLLLVVPMLARAATAVLMATTAYRREQGIARDQAATRPRVAIALVSLAVVIAAGLALPLRLAVLLVLLTAVIVWVWRRVWQMRIGGYTGDVAGALIELVETAALVAAAWPPLWH
ncbi:adenosylcobinamide-GDP ribazoletransferase [Salinisphaera hydrothermalis]|uniref:Adenosylcobinamide-GDP ribazoletransferase n=1 Tax=Salinisphaera hydrothermalis (strain C41B8) TaxID=1304275 RepID=A0A084IIC1_SALHC|nr:adenosylcobinamide-GDP ribazoletransferase [Salinisphaera hydrothermalis]KEZ76455.1 cobalamin 5'-phosphate synthase [Salinisphaera hydrothermalis C41B8]